jgi:hypothetical protein
LPAEQPTGAKNRCADDKEREDPSDAAQSHGLNGLIADPDIVHDISLSLPAIHLSMTAPNARRGGNAEASLVREASSERYFREGCEDAAGASRAKNVASSKNPIWRNFISLAFRD